jgi:hypothetical protein
MCTFLIGYFIQTALSLASIYVHKCAQSRSTLIQLLNNVPDAVILFKPILKLSVYENDCQNTTEIATQFKTLYCNERVDEFFNLNFSKLRADELEVAGQKFL